jgi:hypothetical protein
MWFLFSQCGKCGTLNRRGATACFLSGHGLGTARPETKSDAPRSLAPLTSCELLKSSAPPNSPVSPALSFRISSLVLVIAVVAVCLAILRQDLVAGAILALTVLPALIYTIAVATIRTARGRPMTLFEKFRTFLAAIFGVLLITFCAVAAACVTYLSVGRAIFSAGEVGSIIALGPPGSRESSVGHSPFMFFSL